MAADIKDEALQDYTFWRLPSLRSHSWYSKTHLSGLLVKLQISPAQQPLHQSYISLNSHPMLLQAAPSQMIPFVKAQVTSATACRCSIEDLQLLSELHPGHVQMLIGLWHTESRGDGPAYEDHVSSVMLMTSMHIQGRVLTACSRQSYCLVITQAAYGPRHESLEMASFLPHHLRLPQHLAMQLCQTASIMSHSRV